MGSDQVYRCAEDAVQNVIEEIDNIAEQHAVEDRADAEILSSPDQREDQIDAVHDDCYISQ